MIQQVRSSLALALHYQLNAQQKINSDKKSEILVIRAVHRISLKFIGPQMNVTERSRNGC